MRNPRTHRFFSLFIILGGIAAFLSLAAREIPCAPGTLTETGTFQNSSLYQFALSGNGALMFSAGKNGSSGQAVTIDATRTGSFTTTLASAASTYNSNVNTVSADGTLGAAASLVTDTSYTVDLFRIVPATGAITRLGAVTAPDAPTYHDKIAADPSGRFAFASMHKVAANGSVSGYLYGVIPGASAVSVFARVENRNGAVIDFAISPDGTQVAALLAGKSSRSVDFILYSVDAAGATFSQAGQYSHSVANVSEGAVAYTPDGQLVYCAHKIGPFLVGFNTSSTGSLTPVTPEYNPGYLSISGAMRIAGGVLCILSTNPENAGQVAAQSYSINGSGELTYIGAFSPDSSLLLPSYAAHDPLILSADGKIGAFIFRLNDGSLNAQSRLYSFSTQTSGLNTAPLDSRDYIPGGQFTKMSIRQSTSGARIVAFAESYTFGTAHILSVEAYGGGTQTPTPAPSPTAPPAPSPTPSASPSASPSPLPSAAASPSPSTSPSITPTASPSSSPSISPSISPSPSTSPSATASLSPSASPSPLASPSPSLVSPSPTAFVSPTATEPFPGIGNGWIVH